MATESKPSPLERAQRREAQRYEILEIARNVRAQREKDHRLNFSLRSERALADAIRLEKAAFQAWDKARLALAQQRQAEGAHAPEGS